MCDFWRSSLVYTSCQRECDRSRVGTDERDGDGHADGVTHAKVRQVASATRAFDVRFLVVTCQRLRARLLSMIFCFL